VQVDLSCLDWEARLRAGTSLVPTLPLHTKPAEQAVAVFDKLRLADVPGTPAMAEAGGEWFRDIIRALFGSLDPVTRARFLREVLLLVPKKNSKTTNGALLMLTALLVNLRPKAKFILTGPTQDIAELAFEQIKGAIALDDVLRGLLHVRDHKKTITHRRSGAELEIMTFDPNVLTGQKPAGILIDELHVSAKMSKAASALRQLRGGMLATPEAFMVFITTQSEEPPAGVFRAELLKARAIRDGRQPGVMLPVLYEFPEAMVRSDEWRNPARWAMVTPNAGRSITVDRLREEFAIVNASGGDDLRAWASQHLNIEIGLALRSDGWSGAEYWEANGDPDLTLEALIDRSEVITVGIDGGGNDDLLGIAFLGREKGTRRWLLWIRAFAHPIVLQRRKAEAPRLLDFEDSGDLVLVERVGDDACCVADLVLQVYEAGLLGGVGLDPHGIGHIVDELAERGISGPKLVQGITQGWQLNGAIKTLERMLAGGTLVHAAQPLMAWCVSNAIVVPRGNAISITKAVSGSAKIDALMAALDAVALMSLHPVAQGSSVYDTRGISII